MPGFSLSILPAWLLFLIIVCGSMALACGSLLLVRRWIKPPEDEEHNVLVNAIFASVSLIYTVLLAFLVISVWNNFQAANQAVSQEAAAVITVARNAELLPEPFRGEMLNQLHAYTASVVKAEWYTMREGASAQQLASPQSLAATKQLWFTYGKIPTSATSDEMARSLDELSNDRVMRLMSSQNGLPGFFWFVLVIGAGMTIIFSLILRVQNMRLHIAMVLLLTGMIAICLWLIVLIHDPFIGDTQVSSEPLKYALYVIDSLAR